MEAKKVVETASGKSAAQVLRKFFGLREGQSLKEFAHEFNQLSDEEKLELAELAEIELAKG
jgi:hypothetical protein